jgi:hypothetical protein
MPIPNVDTIVIRYTPAVLVTDLQSGDGPFVKPKDRTKPSTVPLDTDYENGFISGQEATDRAAADRARASLMSP